MYKMTVLLMTMLSFFLTSCSTIFSNKTRQVTVTAQQSDAEVIIDGYALGTAPLLVDLDKRCDHTIVVSKPGYEPQEAFLTSRRGWKSTSNLLFPFAGAAIGTGLGFAYYGNATYIVPFCIAGTAIGAAVGLGLGAIGTATDIYTRSDCDLNAKNVHFNLTQVN